MSINSQNLSRFRSPQNMTYKQQPLSLKTYDKSLPSVQSLKSYTSNPNLSLEYNKAGNAAGSNNGEHADFNFNAVNKNIDKREPHYQNTNSNFHTNNNYRANRADMIKSLVIGQTQKDDSPQENTAKFAIKNGAPRRAYRMSLALNEQDQKQQQHMNSIPSFLSKKQENPNFQKNKQTAQKMQKNQQKKQASKPIPSFINRQILKKSSIVEGSINSKSLFNSSEIKKATKKKVSVDDFIKIKQLGSGKYGRVFLVMERYTKFICALKVIEKKLLHEEQITDQFIRQIKIQSYLNHSNIIKMYGFFDDNAHIYIILEAGTGGQLYHQLKKSNVFQQAKVAQHMKQICEAVNEIHSLRIIHRDIKPQNIVVHQNILKLCDFGWSVHQDNKLRTTFCGTPLYVCPQILKGKQYDERIDIWSIGIMMYEMVVGENPFRITKEEELIKIIKEEIKIPSYLKISYQVRDFLDKCLKKNPQQRANIKQLLNHAFFKNNQDKSSDKKMINM